MKDDIPSTGLPCASPSSPSKTANSKGQPQHIVDVLVHESKWQDELPFNFQEIIDRCFAVTLQNVINSAAPFELSVLLADDIEIQRLNREFRQKDKPTNVLSFESGAPIQSLAMKDVEEGAPPIPLGDIALSYGTIQKEAASQNKAFQDHFTHLMIHGLLHLLGFDHEEDYEAETMEVLEIALLSEHFNINNPYDS